MNDLGGATAARRNGKAARSNRSRIRVMVCDPQPVVRAGLKAILGRNPETVIAGEACDGEEAVAAALRLRPTVVVMDHRMLTSGGIEATRRLAGPGVAEPIGVLLLLTEAVEEEELIAALRAGARGLLRKDGSPGMLVHAVHVVATGGVVLAMVPSVTAEVLDRLLRSSSTVARPPAALTALTARELDVLRLVARGHSNQVIADALSLCEATVKSHLHHLSRKLDLQDRTQAAVLAYETGLIQPGCRTADRLWADEMPSSPPFGVERGALPPPAEGGRDSISRPKTYTGAEAILPAERNRSGAGTHQLSARKEGR
jgi:DNA-binding NarL/FixJ family response regulator